MNKIPKCKSKNSISKQHLKLTKKYSGENKNININHSKIIKHIESDKQLKRESKNSLISNTKPSTLSSGSSKNNSLISNQNVILYLYNL